MPQFIAAVHSEDTTPQALALVEVASGDGGLAYTVRSVRVLGDDPHGEIESLLASERQYVGNTVLVTTGGQKSADALHASGPSAAAVSLRGDGSSDRDALDTTVQVLVDTFEMLYRAGAISTPAPSEAASGAIHAMYNGADLDNAAPSGERDASGDLPGDARGSAAAEIEQSGSSSALSTERIKKPMDAREASAAIAAADVRIGRTAAATSEPAPDLGTSKAPALALALAVWYSETTADELPLTDQADEINSRRGRKNTGRN